MPDNAGTIFYTPRAQFFDNNGDPLNGGKLYTWLSGTTTAQALYTNRALTIAYSNPIELDSAGRVPGGVFWPPVALRVQLTTSADVSVWGPQDDVIPTNLFTGLINTDVPTGHTIGPIDPAFTEFQLAIGGPVVLDGTDDFGVGLYLAPDIDATAQTAVDSVYMATIQGEVALGATGTPDVYGAYLEPPTIATAGATPDRSVTLGVNGAPTIGTLRYAFEINEGTSRLDGGVEIGAEISATLTTDQNNYAPTGIDTAAVLRLTNNTGGTITLTGLASYGANGSSTTVNRPGHTIVVMNVGADSVALAHDSGSSTAGNRFSLPGAGTFTITTGLCVVLIYDGTSARWRVIG